MENQIIAAKKLEVGDSFMIHKNFSNISHICYVLSISPSGQWFRVSGCNISFSTKTLHSRGLTLIDGYHLHYMNNIQIKGEQQPQNCIFTHSHTFNKS
jgi:hypothetical protein